MKTRLAGFPPTAGSATTSAAASVMSMVGRAKSNRGSTALVACATPATYASPTAASLSRSHAGIAAILAGVLIFAGQGGELVFGSPSDLVDAVFVALVGAGIVALGVALWGLRDLIAGTRPGRIGVWLALGGVGLLALFAIQAMVEAIRTGDIPENFILFGLGFLLLIVGHLLFARDLRASLGRAWLLPVAAVAGAIVAIVTEADPVHDIGLFVFEAAWASLGVTLLRAERRRRDTASAVVQTRGA